MVKRFACAAACVLMAASVGYAGSVDTFGIGSRATALGGAYSATADDPFAAYYNPAGLSQIEGKVFAAGAHVVDPTIELSDFSVNFGGKAPNIDNVNFEDESDILIAPHMGYAQKINEKFALGVAVYAPWGLELEWDENAGYSPVDGSVNNPGAYSAYHSYYKRYGVTPTLSYKMNDKLAFGAAVTIGKSEAGVEAKKFAPGSPFADASFSCEMDDDVNYSYNLGVMYKPVETVTFGLTYRSETETEFEGDMVVRTADGTLYDTVGATMEFNHPQQVQAGVRYQPHKQLSMECDLVWTDWSIGQEQATYLDRAVAGTPIDEEIFARDWEDTKQLRFGIEYIVNDMITVRGGYFYDPTPIPDNTLDLQWPDADKKTYSLGTGFNFGRYTIDAVLQYTDIEQARMVGGESENLNGSFGGGLVSTSADGYILGGGVTLTARF